MKHNELTPSVAEEIAFKLHGPISHLAHDLGVIHLHWTDDSVKFTYKGLEVTIQIKTK